MRTGGYGSSVNVLYHEAFVRISLSKEQLRSLKTPLFGFTRDVVEAKGVISLDMEIGEYPCVRSMVMDFMVVRLECAHNGILGRLGLEDLGALISLEHLCMKFHTPNRVGVSRGEQRIARKCYLNACKKIDEKDRRVHTICEKASKEDSRARPKPVDELEKIVLDVTQEDQLVRISTDLPAEIRADIIQVLKRYAVVFAWGLEDMPRIDPNIMCHQLHIDPAAKLVKQRRRHLSTERRDFVKKETKTLLAIGYIREVQYPTLLSNVVLAPRPPMFRMCVDFSDLNKACPMDPFPLPQVDQLIDETA